MPVRLVKRPKTPYLVVRGTVGGMRIEESTGTADRRVAEEIRIKREAELRRRLIYGEHATASVARGTRSYLENGGDRRFLVPVLDYFGTTLLSRIGEDALDVAA